MRSSIMKLSEKHWTVMDVTNQFTIHGLSEEGKAYRTALVAIQELHPKEYASSGDEAYDLNPRCGNCGTAFPCDTRRLADESLESEHD